MILERDSQMVHIKNIKVGKCFKTNEEDDNAVYMKTVAVTDGIFHSDIMYPCVDIESGVVFSFIGCFVEPVEIVAREKKGE